MTAAFLPFNQNPDSVAIKTSSYTIPAGFYARVIATNFETDFTIDSVIAIEKTYYTATTAASAGVKFTNTTPYKLIGGFAGGGNSLVAINIASDSTNSLMYGAVGSPFASSTPSAFATGGTRTAFNFSSSHQTNNLQVAIYMNPNDVMYQVTAVATKYTITAMDAPTEFITWVPTGTDLDGSSYVVELYAIP